MYVYHMSPYICTTSTIYSTICTVAYVHVMFYMFIDKPLTSSEIGSLYNPTSKLMDVEKQVSSSPKQLTSIDKISVSCVFNPFLTT